MISIACHSERAKQVKNLYPRLHLTLLEEMLRFAQHDTLNLALSHLSNILNRGGSIMTTAELTEIKAAKTVDARGSACPGPLLEAKKGIGAIKVGEVLEIWSGDPNTKVDIPRWSAKVGHDFLGVIPADGYDRIFIKRLK
jgi:tRNA 2-thiouridine synthesizing protein A